LVAAAAAAAAVVFAWGLFAEDAPPPAYDAPGFAAAGPVDHVYDGEYTFFVGGGVAAFDCSGDAVPDLYFAGGVNPAGLYRNDSSVGGALAFSEVAGSGADLTGVTGAYPIDIDSDGLIDLAVLRLGSNEILRGVGDCRFEAAGSDWGIDGGDMLTTGFSATWESGETWPTLAFGNYVALDDDGDQAVGCNDNTLIRPAGAGYAEPTVLAPGYCSLSVLFSDWSRTGAIDLRVANDRHYYRGGEEQLWRIEPGAPPRLYERDDGWEQLQIWGMGIASHDVTGDGYPEVFLTSMGDNKLQTLENGADEPSYVDIALDSGVTAHRPFTGDVTMPSTAWHAEFDDVNNDGYVDLFITKGNVDAMQEAASADPNNLLLGQPGGSFAESAAEAGILNLARSRGAAVVDLNMDGLLDLVEVNRREPVTIWRNTGTDGDAGNWLAIRPQQDGANRDAVAGWIEVMAGDRLLVREVTIGGGHAGGQLGWIHFGLGDETEASVRITWPDGETEEWRNVAVNRFVTITRGDPTVSPRPAMED
jgi:hypothetical protein